MKKRLTLMLALALVLALFLTGCTGSQTQPTESSAPTTSEPAQAESAQTESAQPESSQTAETLAPVTLKWYVPSGSTAAVTADGYDAVIAAMNAISEPAINAKMDLQLVDFGNYENKMQTIIASGENYDLTFTANWFNSIVSNVSKGAFAALDELLPSHAPTLMAETPAYAWDAVTIGGNIYAMHCRQNWNRSEGIYVRKDLADKYGFTPKEITPIEDLEALYAQMREGEPADFYPTYVDASFRWPYYLLTNGFEEVAGRNVPAAYRLNGSDFKLVNQFATEEFKEYVIMMRRWNELGYIRNDSATYSLTSDNYVNDLKAGKIGTNQLGFVAPHVKAMAESGWDNKYEAVTVQTGEGWAENNIIQSSLTAVGVNSKNKERAVMYYDLVVATPELYNTMLWGVEGVNFEKVSDTQVRQIPDTGYGSGGWTVVPDWACGHQFKGWVPETQMADIWKQVEDWSNQGKPSGILGFVFNPASVQTEIANCSAVVDEQLRMLDTGSLEDVEAGLNDFLSKLQVAGSDKILAEAQRQMDEWVAQYK